MAQFIIYVPKYEDESNKTITAKEPLSNQKSKTLEGKTNATDSNSTNEKNGKTKEKQENKKNEDKTKHDKDEYDESDELDMPLEKILHLALDYFHIHNAVWTLTDDNKYFQVTFPCEAGDRLENIMTKLSLLGIGEKDNSSMSVVACSLYFHPEEEEEDNLQDNAAKEEQTSHKKNQFIQSIKSRMTVAQVVEGVKYLATPSFDFVVLNILAALLAALGLAENSPVSLVASMLVSPLIGPIMGATFGVIIRDRKLQNLGFKSELLGLFLCVMSGFVFGLITSHFSQTWGGDSWPTAEMKNRGTLRSLWIGVLISLPSGAGVALSILGGNQGSLVGVAISAALLPPAVNGGILWALALVRQLKSLFEEGDIAVNPNGVNNQTIRYILRDSLKPPQDYESVYFANMARELALLGITSLGLTIINSLCIFLTGVVVLKIKEVAPYKNLNPTKDFWTQDIKVARDYNIANRDNEDDDDDDDEPKPPGKRLLEEWAALNEIDPEGISIGIPDDKTAEVALSFKDMIEEIEGDPKYQGVIRGLPPRSMPQPFSRVIPPEWKKLEAQVAIENSLQQTIQGLTPLSLRKGSLISLPTDSTGYNSVGRTSIYGGRLSNAFLHPPYRRSLSISSGKGVPPNMRGRSPSAVETGQFRRDLDKIAAKQGIAANTKFSMENEFVKPKIKIESSEL